MREGGERRVKKIYTKEQLLSAADNDLKLHGHLTVDTLNAVRESGFRYESGNLLLLQELAQQGLKNRGKYPEVYRLSLGEAKSRGELDRFWSSEQLDTCCRLSMDSAVFMNSQDGVLEQGCLNRVLEEYGFDRVEWILAHTIWEHRDAPQISRENRDWADTFHVPRSDPVGGSMWLGCVMSSPVWAVEMAASMIREAHGRERDRTKVRSMRHKVSIRQQLTDKSTADKRAGRDSDIVKKVAERGVR